MAMAIERPRSNRWLLWLVGTLAVLGVFALMVDDWGQLWKISSAPDNVPIVGMIPLVIFFTWLGLKQSKENDQLGFWAVTVGTNMARATPMLGSEGPFGPQLGMTPFNDVRFGLLGGSIVDANALLRSYIWHCIGIPVVASLFMAVHFWRIRKDGGISGPAPVMLESEMKAVKK